MAAAASTRYHPATTRHFSPQTEGCIATSHDTYTTRALGARSSDGQRSRLQAYQYLRPVASSSITSLRRSIVHSLQLLRDR